MMMVRRPLSAPALVVVALLLGVMTATIGRAHSASQAADGEFPKEWFWEVRDSSARFASMIGKPPPPLTVTGWVGEAQSLEALKGKVVIVDFWGTWCRPCREALPELAQLAKDRADEGLAVIGVHDAKRGSDKMVEIAKAAGVAYPLCIDDASKSATAWKVSFWPTIAVIDRAGNLRAIGLQPNHTKAVVEKLLAEPAPTPPAPPAEGEKPAP